MAISISPFVIFDETDVNGGFPICVIETLYWKEFNNKERWKMRL
jgi:hypothetical protein